MSNIAIKVEGLSKSYLVGHNRAQTERYTALRDVIARNARDLARKTRDMIAGRPIVQGDEVEEFWALKDVSFEVQHGETLGIIGRNGAGKSTLLKILSRITEPTTGRITINGRVASLLEVGTGFHPELTGRENIFLNGAILGMTRAEILRKFDEIVAFAEVENFLDTPVKRYSSGMYVRLAFSVAAHLEPEILVVDEVLAVGDLQFQKKCLGKMNDISQGGRTVIFVSHNMAAIRQLCSVGMVFNDGVKSFHGDSSHAVDTYLKLSGYERFGEHGVRTIDPDDSKDFQVTRVTLKNSHDEITNNFDCDESITIAVECISRVAIPGLYGYMGLLDRDGQSILVSDSYDVMPNRFDLLKPGYYSFSIIIPPRTIGHGEYTIALSFASNQANTNFYLHRIGEVLSFSLNDTSSMRGNERGGFFSTLLAWNLTPVIQKAHCDD